ncbi:MAG TPA: MFS transporter [Rubrobacteraceae bacterium]|nr:MFS transporter [Rubrobacteraceae bacterium]
MDAGASRGLSGTKGEREMSASSSGASERGGSATRRVLVLCWVAVALDGFDLVVLRAVTPALLGYEAWGLTPPQVGTITSFGLVGMMIGALGIRTLADVTGRRTAIMISVASFSVFTALLGLAPSPEVFGLFRFLAGLGLGGLIPTAATLVSEYARMRRGSSSITFMMTGYHVGGVLTAVLAILILPALGWRAMFVIGGLPALVLVPLMLKYLPEFPSFLVARGRRDEAEALAAWHGIPLAPDEVRAEEHASEGGGLGAIKTLFSSGYLLGTLAFSVASFMGLLLVYGLNQWLPTIMRDAGYALGAALAFLLVLNLGAVIGLLLAGPVADRYGSKTVNVAWFALAAVSLFLLSVQMPLVLTYLAVLVTGVWVFQRPGVAVRLREQALSDERSRHGVGLGRGHRARRRDLRPPARRAARRRRARRAVGLLRLRTRRPARGHLHRPRAPLPRRNRQGAAGTPGGGDIALPEDGRPGIQLRDRRRETCARR